MFAVGHKDVFSDMLWLIKYTKIQNKITKGYQIYIQKESILFVRCNPYLQNSFDCGEIQAFIRRSSSLSWAATVSNNNTGADALVTHLKVATGAIKKLYDRFCSRKIERSLVLAYFVTDCDMPCFWWGVFEWEMRAFTEWIRIIFWIIFSAINNLNSALFLTQNCCIPPERTVTATHRHLDYSWYFWNKLLWLHLSVCHVFLYTVHIFKK